MRGASTRSTRACAWRRNLYNLGLAQGLAGADEATVVLRAGPAAPALRPDRDQRGRRDAHLVRLSHDAVHLPRRVQGPRLPQPLPSGRPRCAARRRAAACRRGPEAEEARKRIPPRLKVPVTALLRIEDVSTGIATGNLRGRIEVYAADAATTAEIGGASVPLELGAHGGPRLPARGLARLGHRDRRVPLGLQAAVSRRAAR